MWAGVMDGSAYAHAVLACLFAGFESCELSVVVFDHLLGMFFFFRVGSCRDESNNNVHGYLVLVVLELARLDASRHVVNEDAVFIVGSTMCSLLSLDITFQAHGGGSGSGDDDSESWVHAT